METPMTLFECLGTAQAWRIIVTHSAICLVYAYITIFRFVPAARNASTQKGRLVWWSIAFIFPFCALSGYMTTVLAAWYPALAYPLKEAGADFDIVACMVFLIATNRQILQSVSNDQFENNVTLMMNESTDRQISDETVDVTLRLKAMITHVEREKRN